GGAVAQRLADPADVRRGHHPLLCPARISPSCVTCAALMPQVPGNNSLGLACPKGRHLAHPKCERVKTMGWFRSRMRLGSWSALFALTIQLVLSFEHLHFDGASPRSVSAQTVSLRTVLAPL